jgi:hypothetical protein
LQTGAGATGFITAPTVSSTFLEWTGSAFTWAAGGGGGGGGTVTSVAASGGSTGLTFSGTPITTTGTLTLGGLLGVGYGGTGVASPTAHGVMVAEGSSAMTVATTGTTGNMLVDQGSGNDPKFQIAGTVVLATGCASCADPTDTNDSTTAIQNFVNTVVDNGYHGMIPPGTYKLSAAISVPFGVGYLIEGNARGGTTFSQTAANTPIFNFASGSGGVGGHSFAINDITFVWTTTPTVSQTHSIAVAFNNSAETWFDFQLNRITCNNGYECIGIDSASNGTIWGVSIRDLVVGGTACSAFDDSAGGTGQPNISIDGAYLTALDMTATCPIINTTNNDSGWYNHIEINADPNGNTILYGTGVFAIGTIKVEDATFANGQFVFQFPNAHATISALDMEDMTIAATGGSVVGIDINAGGATSTVTVGQVNLTFATGISGDFYLANDYGGAPTYSLRFLSSPVGLLGTTNAFLTNTPGAISDGGVSVDDWQQDRLSADNGNTSPSWAIGSPNIILFNTALTAARTVTLTDAQASSTNSNLYNGFHACVLKTFAAGTTYAVTVKNSAATTLGSIPAADAGKVCFMWSRSTSWVVSSYEIWTSATP